MFEGHLQVTYLAATRNPRPIMSTHAATLRLREQTMMINSPEY